MSGSINKVILIGRLGKDPEVRRMSNGDPVVNLSVATSESWRDKAGERQERTTWHRVVIFNDHLAKTAENYLKKGAQVYLEGSLQTRSWEKDGQTRYATEVVLQKFRGELTMLDGKPETGGGGYSEPNPDAPKEDFRNADLEDSIPFASCVGIW